MSLYMSNDEPTYQLGIVQGDLRRNDANFEQLEEAWKQDPQHPMYAQKYERLAKKERLLLEERKIWAGASLQNNSWQASLSNSTGVKELLNRLLNAYNSGGTHELLSHGHARARPRAQHPARSHPRTQEPRDQQLMMLCDAAQATEVSGPGQQTSEWRSTRPGQYKELWARDSPSMQTTKRRFSERSARKHALARSKFATVAFDGVGYDVNVRKDNDEGLAAYVAAKLSAAVDESCTEREPTGYEISQGGVSFASEFVDKNYVAADMSGGTNMSQHGNVTPARSNNGAQVMHGEYSDFVPYQRSFADKDAQQPEQSGMGPARSNTSGRSLRQNTHPPSRYDESQFALQPH